MKAESIIKGRISGLVVSLMLQEAGYLVFRYGYEGVPESLAQIGSLKKKKILQLIASTPHFVVIDKRENEPHLVVVKLQGKSSSGRNIPWGRERISNTWPDATLISVRTIPPYFSLIVEEDSKVKSVPLKDAHLFKIKEELIKKYGLLAQKFLD